MTDQAREFISSDAWLLCAIFLASKKQAASLTEIIAAGDTINHAIFTQDELEGGLGRLIQGGYVEATGGKFRTTDFVLREFGKHKRRKGSLLGQLEDMESFLEATFPDRGGLERA